MAGSRQSRKVNILFVLFFVFPGKARSLLGHEASSSSESDEDPYGVSQRPAAPWDVAAADKFSTAVSEEAVKSVKKENPAVVRDSHKGEKVSSLVFTKEDPEKTEPTHIMSRDIKIEVFDFGVKPMSVEDMSNNENTTEEQSESDIEIDVEK